MRIACGNQLSPTQNLMGNGMQASARNAQGSSDPYWANVVLLAGNDNAADGTATFLDQSNSAHVITGVGNVQYDSAQAPTGMTTSMLYDGTGDYQTIPDSDDWNLGSGDFTLEQWVRMSTLDYFFSGPWTINPGSNNGWVFFFDNAGKTLNLTATADGSTAATPISKAWNPSVDTWYPIAVTRSGTTFELYVSGTSLGTATSSIAIANVTTVMNLATTAALDAVGLALTGWFGPVRLTKGVARYSGNYAVPSLPLPTATT